MTESTKKTTFELAADAREQFGVDLDPSHPRPELVRTIRRLKAQTFKHRTADTKPEKPPERVPGKAVKPDKKEKEPDK